MKLVNAPKSEHVLPSNVRNCPNHEQHRQWSPEKPLLERSGMRERCKCGWETLSICAPVIAREHERDRFDTVGGLAPSLRVAAYAFSVQQTDRSSRQTLSTVKRNVKRFHVNG
jgi:hypothetical protein